MSAFAAPEGAPPRPSPSRIGRMCMHCFTFLFVWLIASIGAFVSEATAECFSLLIMIMIMEQAIA